jgi:tetratricopeptide (TPR) repeat protein
LAEGRTEGAPLDLLEQACALATTPHVEAEIRLARGERLVATGPAAARVELEKVLELAEASTDTLRGRALAGLGEVAWSHGLVAEASARLRAALAVHLRAGDRRAIARTSALLAHVDRLEIGKGAARELLEQAQEAADELGDPIVRARVLMDVGQHLTRTGDQAGAQTVLAEASLLYEQVGFARDRAFLHLHVAETHVGVGDFDRALEEARAALAALPDAEDVGRSTIYEAIGCIHLLRSELAEAQRWIEDGLKLARASSAARSECTLLGKRGLVYFVSGEPERAFEQFDLAVKKNEARGAVPMVGESLADRAMASLALGREAAAKADLARARELLHDPPPERAEGRMLAVCEIVGRAFGQVRKGTLPAKALAQARANTGKIFDRLPPEEWDLVLRLAAWLVSRIAA